MTCGLLQIEEKKDDVVGMISFKGKKAEMCRLQHIKGHAPVFQTKIDGLTWSDKCFTLDELERQWKAKNK